MGVINVVGSTIARETDRYVGFNVDGTTMRADFDLRCARTAITTPRPASNDTAEVENESVIE